MKRGVVAGVILSALAVVCAAGWWVWRQHYSVQQLSRAVAAGELARANVLLAMGADVEAWRRQSSAVQFMYAVAKGEFETATWMRTHGADTARWRADVSALHLIIAVEENDEQKVRTLVSWGARAVPAARYPIFWMDAYDPEEPLVSEVYLGSDYSRSSDSIVSDLGSDPATVALYESPLHLAAQKGNAEIVRMLLDAGADPSLQAYYVPMIRIETMPPIETVTPLDIVRKNGHSEVVALLEQALKAKNTPETSPPAADH